MPSGQRNPQRSTIWVVDDDPHLLAALRFSLETDGFAVRGFLDGKSLLAAWQPSAAHCLVIDHILPGVSGLEVLENLRTRDARVPVIMITTHPTLRFRQRAAQLDATVVEKPLLGDHLVRAISERTAAKRLS
jgi:two-component system, LuxR family, response regulator FixJ